MLICTAWAAWGQERPCCPGPSGSLPVPGGVSILGCVPLGHALWGLRHWSDAPSAAQPRLLRSTPGALPELLPGPHLVRSPPGCSSSVSAPGSLRAFLPLLGSCWNSLGTPFCLGRLVKLLLLLVGAFLSWGHWPRGLSWAPCGAPPPWMLFYFCIIFSPIFLP